MNSSVFYAEHLIPNFIEIRPIVSERLHRAMS